MTEKKPGLLLKQFTKFPNAGDIASSYIVGRVLDVNIERWGEEPLDHPNLLAIGSILHWADAHTLVWGSGLIAENIVPRTNPAKIAAVRGRFTAERLHLLGIPVPSVFGDPGILISDLYKPPARPNRRVVLIPHYVDISTPFVEQALHEEVEILSPLSPLEDYLSSIANASVVISSSLHGIIFAHSYGVPATWVRISDGVIGDGFKFRDYYSSIGIAANQIPDLRQDTTLSQLIDHATLPKTEMNRDRLLSALYASADYLMNGFANVM